MYVYRSGGYNSGSFKGLERTHTHVYSSKYISTRDRIIGNHGGDIDNLKGTNTFKGVSRVQEVENARRETCEVDVVKTFF